MVYSKLTDRPKDIIQLLSHVECSGSVITGMGTSGGRSDDAVAVLAALGARSVLSGYAVGCAVLALWLHFVPGRRDQHRPHDCLPRVHFQSRLCHRTGGRQPGGALKRARRSSSQIHLVARRSVTLPLAAGRHVALVLIGVRQARPWCMLFV